MCQIEMLKREIEQSLQERDKAMRENHDLREKYGGPGKSQSDLDHGMAKHASSRNRGVFDLDKHRKDR